MYSRLHPPHTRLLAAAALALAAAFPAAAAQVVLYAVGQAFGAGHNHDTGNFLWSISLNNGHASQIAPISTGIAGLATAPDGTIYGRSGTALYTVDPYTAAIELVGTATVPGSATSLDILPDGRAYALPFNADFDTAQLFQVDLGTGEQTPIGDPNAITTAIDTAFPERDMTYGPFIISLGSVGEFLYGMDLETNTLIEIDPDTGDALALGDYDAAAMETDEGRWSGLAGLTGVDTNGDGVNDELYGVANYYQTFADNSSSAMGAIIRYDILTSRWDLVGTNPDVIFYSLTAGQVVPEPATMTLLGLGAGALALRRRFARKSV